MKNAMEQSTTDCTETCITPPIVVVDGGKEEAVGAF